jgi:uncharacterized membrane protein
MDAIKRIIQENKRFFGLILGLVVGILIVTINLWRTLLIVVCAWLGWYLSGKNDVKDKIYKLAERIFTRNKN